MTRLICTAAVAAIVAGCSQSADTAAQAAAEPTREARIEHGRYLVNQVGMCIDCHTPRLETGELDPERWLQGATLDFAPTVEMPVWADVSPALAGALAGYTEDELVAFLVAGAVRADGTRPRPPMPPYKLNEDDARAVAAYLASLPAE